MHVQFWVDRWSMHGAYLPNPAMPRGNTRFTLNHVNTKESSQITRHCAHRKLHHPLPPVFVSGLIRIIKQTAKQVRLRQSWLMGTGGLEDTFYTRSSECILGYHAPGLLDLRANLQVGILGVQTGHLLRSAWCCSFCLHNGRHLPGAIDGQLRSTQRAASVLFRPNRREPLVEFC